MTSILITDDHQSNIEYLSELLLTLDETIKITSANDGIQATKAVSEQIESTGKSFDMIFMDFQMPGVNGEVTTDQIRELESAANAKSIIITWSSAKESPYPNADDWLAKPPRKEDVAYLLEVYCS